MKFDPSDVQQCKQILKVSEGFPSPVMKYKAKAVDGTSGKRVVSPSRSGHSLAEHLRGVSSTTFKTKFCSKDDMALALSLLLTGSQGKAALNNLKPGQRLPIRARLGQVLGVEAEIAGVGKQVVFSRSDMAKARVTDLTCVAVLEGRVRDGDMIPHVQTFYPVLSEEEINKLLLTKSAD